MVSKTLPVTFRSIMSLMAEEGELQLAFLEPRGPAACASELLAAAHDAQRLQQARAGHERRCEYAARTAGAPRARRFRPPVLPPK